MDNFIANDKEKKIKNVSHCIIKNESLFCTHCGFMEPLALPMETMTFIEKSASFLEAHENCIPTYKEPSCEDGKSVEERMNWWLEYGERGISSETIFSIMSGKDIRHSRGREYGHPYDSDDFSRCYKLLKLIPEWRSLDKMKTVSKEWSNLVDNWDKLTEMFEENERTNWVNSEKIGMYYFMRKILSEE